MRVNIVAAVLTLALPHWALAVQGDTAQAQEAQDKPEEIVITGERQLRKQLMEAEIKAYDTFNKFNDEKRFTISCSTNARINSHLVSQTCAPEFEIQATSAHAGAFAESMHNFRNPTGGQPDGNVVETGEPMEVTIGRQQAEYKKKMKQVAEQHPEFLDAVKQYSKLRQQYEGAARKTSP